MNMRGSRKSLVKVVLYIGLGKPGTGWSPGQTGSPGTGWSPGQTGSPGTGKLH